MSSTIKLSFIVLLFSSCTIEKKEEVNSMSETKSPPSGKVIYNERCTSCHGADGKLGFGGAKDLTVSIKTLTEIEHQVIHGKGAMTPFKNILSVEEISAVSQHALSLQKK